MWKVSGLSRESNLAILPKKFTFTSTLPPLSPPPYHSNPIIHPYTFSLESNINFVRRLYHSNPIRHPFTFLFQCNLNFVTPTSLSSHLATSIPLRSFTSIQFQLCHSYFPFQSPCHFNPTPIQPVLHSPSRFPSTLSLQHPLPGSPTNAQWRAGCNMFDCLP